MAFEYFFGLGMIAVFAVMCYINKYYQIPVWKVAVSCASLAVIGMFGVKLMSYIESGNWSGRSFFGAVFLIPILMVPVAKLLKTPYGDLMDLMPPAGCIMLALLKVKCKLDGCCFGRIMLINGNLIRFPSQIVECIAAILLMIVMIIIIKTGNWRGFAYAWVMFLYGISRLILNSFRETSPWIGTFSSGSFWSLISIVIGASILLWAKKYNSLSSKKT